MKQHGQVKLSVDGRIAKVVLSNPERMNALDSHMMVELVRVFERIHFDRDIWVATITGEGEDAFSTGGDLKERPEDREPDSYSAKQPMHGVVRSPFEAVIECAKPVVSILNGATYGGGLELALASDIRIASEKAILALSEVKVGLGGTFGTQVLPRTVPVGIAFDMLYTGRSISAEEAARWGLVNYVVPHDGLSQFADEYVARLLETAPLTQRKMKAAIYAGRDLPLSAALRLNVGPDVFGSKDRIEGRQAFVEKRKPKWRAE